MKNAERLRADSSSLLHPSSLRRAGFSFAEILFAVAVLGIGFIMIAAIFPVAIQQTQAAMELTVGTAATRNGVAYLQGCLFINAAHLPFTNDPSTDPASPTPPNPGRVFSFNDPRINPAVAPNNQPTPNQKPLPDALWKSIEQSLIVPEDARYAAVPLYSRDGGAPFARAFIFGMRVRSRDTFKSPLDTERQSATACAELEPRPIKILLKYRSTAPVTSIDHAYIANLAGGDDPSAALVALSSTSDAEAAADSGAYVVISDDKVNDDPLTNTNERGQLNGRVYQLGNEVLPSTKAGYREFELATDMESASENIPGLPSGSLPGVAFVIGRGYADPAAPGTYAGSVEVVQYYPTAFALP